MMNQAPRLFTVKRKREVVLITSSLANAINYAKSEYQDGVTTIWSPMSELLGFVVSGTAYGCKQVPEENAPILSIYTGDREEEAKSYPNIKVERYLQAAVTLEATPNTPVNDLIAMTLELATTMPWRFSWKESQVYMEIPQSAESRQEEVLTSGAT